ncbi:SusC/RagA family TonB-linked outer membrane protein [Flavobacterium selenitireducens]|uniref:SusC/RagA family TonB-linked outer membrane protein n=1 Tax=Flavobacterium selenitireducens TaxID=2722704 RepID=UPI00168B94AC|nr:TonB-dependent receptor [Flavobacterium selenitireducens]MBD3583652.1 TonB-dependent receptor [Flavobacterium selenitireducens]
MKFKKVLFFCISALLFSFIGHAQNLSITGKVTDETGLPVPGTTVTVKGTQTASMTDIDGNYQISAPSNGTLVFSFIGYQTLEQAINGNARQDARITSSAEALEEVVVVGYGTQKKSVVTGAISKVRAQDLENQPVTRVEQSLQGRTSGVIVAANAGQPGSAATVRVRGVTTLNDNDPLYVVDGILVDATAVQYLNQYDIESMEVLKDASASIYGTRAAGGVIVITTKKGKSGKLSLNYNGFAGFQNEARRVGVLNASQYATLRNEAHINGGGSPGGLPFPDPQSYGRGTDWQDQIFQNAFRESHDLSISGGNDKSNFYASFSLIDQEGIVMPSISRYQRKTFRLNSDHKITNFLRIGQTATYTNEKNIGLGNTNSEFGGPLASALNLDPITPVLMPNPTPGMPFYNNPRAVRNEDGILYGISPYVSNEMSNPLAYAQTRMGNFGWADNFSGNIYAELEPIAGLKWRTTASGKLAYYGSQAFTPEYFLTPILSATENNFYREKRSNFFWSIENTLSYARAIKDHNISVLLGQGSYVWEGEEGQGTTFFNLPITRWQDASFNFPVPIEDQTTWAATGQDIKLTSLFARLNYDYKEKYLLSALIRRDGSTNFGANNKFGNFPSISIGWVPTKEGFWPENDYVTQLKLRASYGVAGNDRGTEPFSFASIVGGGFNYTYGPGGSVAIGNTILRPANPNLKWEETTNRNVAVDLTLMNNLTLTVDVFNKKTTGILRALPIPGYVGLGNPLANLGEVENKGVEFELGYRKSFGDFKVGVNGNISFLKNKINSIAPDVDFYDVANVQSSTYQISRNQVGESFGSFYGFVTQGIFQNQAEIDAYVGPDGSPIQPNAVPGDFRWKDLNNDGSIDGDDRKVIGKPLPDYTYGITVNFEYKNFDLSIFGQGVGGNQIYNGLRRLDLGNANWQNNALNRWTGEGTSNSYPRVSTTDNNRNFSNPSTFYLEDGDYFRIKTIQLGYNLPSDLIGKAGLSKVRLYVMSENLLTFTKYTGFDPEIGGNVLGIDRGYYPQARSILMGVNLQL